ncbi:MAG: hypothetical protein HY704_06230 [Gemmatimonadetes bacterium]|nr:hypothetical protein [Gemmatimonadota bacterium]
MRRSPQIRGIAGIVLAIGLSACAAGNDLPVAPDSDGSLAADVADGDEVASGGGWIEFPSIGPGGRERHHHSFAFTLQPSEGVRGFPLNLQYVDHHAIGNLAPGEPNGFGLHINALATGCRHGDGVVEMHAPGVQRPHQTGRNRPGPSWIPDVAIRFKDSAEPGSSPGAGPDRFHLEFDFQPPPPPGQPPNRYGSGPEEISGGNIQLARPDLIPRCLPPPPPLP